jgi:hypothetical protein
MRHLLDERSVHLLFLSGELRREALFSIRIFGTRADLLRLLPDQEWVKNTLREEALFTGRMERQHRSAYEWASRLAGEGILAPHRLGNNIISKVVATEDVTDFAGLSAFLPSKFPLTSQL